MPTKVKRIGQIRKVLRSFDFSEKFRPGSSTTSI